MIRSYTFDNFCTYKGNEVAFLAAKKITELPGEVFNPFYVYGNGGLGKTHLLRAINNVLSKRYTTLFLSVSEFERRVETNASFDSPVIVDDIHLLHDDYLDRMQEIVERAVANDIQICLSAAAAPRATTKFTDKFCSLMESGLVCNVCPPEKEARLQIIMKKAEEAGTILGDDVAVAFADVPVGSIKTIEDMIDRLVAYASLGDLPSDIDRVQLIIKEFFPKERSCVSPSVLADTTRKGLGELVSTDRADLKEEFERKTRVWEMKGFDVALLKQQATGDEASLRHAYGDYIEKIQRLFDLQLAFQSIDRERHSVEAMQIESMLFDPAKLSEIEKIIASFDRIPKPSKSHRKFSDFIVGSCNREAWRVYHDEVVSDLGKHNPMVIFGAAGTGKTHFLEAVCDDLLSSGRAVLFHDYAGSEKSGPDTDRENYDCVVLDNIQAILDDHGHLRDALALIDLFIHAAKQVFIGSIPPSEQSPFPNDLQEILDRGLIVELGRPSVDVTGEYIRARKPEQADDIIEQGIPEFASFYEIEYYLDSFAKDENMIVPLGLPGEDIAPPGVAAPLISDVSSSGDTVRALSKKGRTDSRPDLNYMIPDVQDELIDEKF